MPISANTVIQDALALIDVVAPGEEADAWWSQLGLRLLNAMLSEWSSSGLYNPSQNIYQLDSTSGAPFYTVGSDSLRTLSSTRYDVVATVDVAGEYFRSVDGTVTAYKTVGTGTRYSLVVTEDTAGTYFAVNGGYSQVQVGDIPVSFGQIQSVQVDLGTVTYNPTKITLEEYFSLSVKQVQAPPTYWACDYNQPVSKLYFWPQLQPNLTLRIVGSALIDNVGKSQSQINLDQQWYAAVLYNLATMLYPYLKREAGIDKEIVYQAKHALSGMRSTILARRAKKVTVPYGDGRSGSSFWISPLNTVNQG